MSAAERAGEAVFRSGEAAACPENGSARRRANLSFFVPHAGCPHRCLFCDQAGISGRASGPTPDEVRAACEEHLSDRPDRRYEIAFFGGSFTAIDRRYMTALLEAAAPFVRAGRAAGIRLSTRPDAVDDETLRLLRSFGVTAVELGAQSMDDAVLRANGRGHTAEDVRRASAAVKAAGLELGLQMMVGLYGETDPEEAARQTAYALAALRPDTVRIYPTLVLEGAGLAALWRAGRYQPLTLEQAIAVTAPLLSFFEEQGIRVIRAGLHAEPGLESCLLAGPWHPAFRDLCEGWLLRQAIQYLLASAPRGAYTVYVAPGGESRAAGNGRCNLRYFGQQGYWLTIRPRTGPGRYQAEL